MNCIYSTSIVYIDVPGSSCCPIDYIGILYFQVGEKLKKFGMPTPNKCRTPGLTKSANKRKSLPDPKQLSLRDMFGFKK